jgi:AsmA-like C-terminal region
MPVVFTKADTQQGVNNLSQSALGDKNHKAEDDGTDPRNVLSDLKGHVLLRNGIATFSNLSFGVPGALAQMQGTYDLIREKIDLHGTLKTEAEVSKTTHGIKALMLKMLDPFFKNKPNGYLAPVKITGTYDHPAFGLDLGDSRNNSNQHPKVHSPRLPDQAKQ